MLATTVLATGLTHLTDARYFAAWGVDYLCFTLDPAAPEAITLDYVTALREWVAGPTVIVAPGPRPTPALLDACRAAGLTHLYVDWGADLAALNAAGFRCIVRLPVAGYDDGDTVRERIGECATAAAATVVDFTDGGITLADLRGGRPFPAGFLANTGVLVDLDLNGEDPRQVVSALGLGGLVVRGSSEEKVGYKSFDDLDDLFERLEVL